MSRSHHPDDNEAIKTYEERKAEINNEDDKHDSIQEGEDLSRQHLVGLNHQKEGEVSSQQQHEGLDLAMSQGHNID